MYIYVYICISICMCIYIYIYICVCVYIQYIHVCVCIYIYIYIYIYNALFLDIIYIFYKNVFTYLILYRLYFEKDLAQQSRQSKFSLFWGKSVPEMNCFCVLFFNVLTMDIITFFLSPRLKTSVYGYKDDWKCQAVVGVRGSDFILSVAWGLRFLLLCFCYMTYGSDLLIDLNLPQPVCCCIITEKQRLTTSVTREQLR